MTFRKGPSYVYFIRALDAVKVGFSQIPDERLKHLQAKVPTRLVMLGYVRGGYNEERRLKGAFAGMKLYGEWYAFDGFVRELVQNILRTRRIPQNPSRFVTSYWKRNGK